MFSSRWSRLSVLFAGLFLSLSLVAIDQAEARRGGSFGSRGARTYQAPPPTRTAPQQTAPVDRSMSPNTNQNASQPGARQNAATPQRPGGFMNGMGGAMMRGLLLGGLIGLFMGSGFGGLAGMLGLLLQVLLIGGAIYLVIRLMRGSQTNQRPVPAGMPRMAENAQREQPRQQNNYFAGAGMGGSAAASVGEDFVLEQGDLETFQQRLADVQGAYAREDFAALRELATPEMVSFFSEELAENATKGVRNEVRDVELLQADIAESWREDQREYATAAMRYSAIDVMRDRSTNAIVEGDEAPSETTELWTFVRPRGGVWTLSAIQQA